MYRVWKLNLPPSCHEGICESEDPSPYISKLNFPPLPFIHSPFFDWIYSRTSPRIKQDASQIHIEHRKDEVWEPWSTVNHRLCHKPIPSMWQWTRYWLQTLSVIQCWRWGVFCLHLHDSATEHVLLELPKPKNNIQRYSATYYQHWHSRLPFFFFRTFALKFCWSFDADCRISYP